MHRDTLVSLFLKEKDILENIKFTIEELAKEIFRHIILVHTSKKKQELANKNLAHQLETFIAQRDIKNIVRIFYFDRYYSNLGYFPHKTLHFTEHIRLSEFYKLVISIPNYKVYVLDYYYISTYPGNSYNPFLAEIYSIYSSVAYNAGNLHSKVDTFPISALIVKHIFTRLIKNPPPKNYDYYNFWNSLGENLSMPYTIPLVFVNGQWMLFYEINPKSKKVSVLEIVRKRNADKNGYNKYRFRNTTLYHESMLQSTNDMYSPLNNWWAFDWHIKPNEWTIKLRKCIYASVKFLQNNNIKAFTVSEGGAFKGTVMYGSDVDTNCYMLESQASDTIKRKANQVFITTSRRLGVNFKDQLWYKDLKDDQTELPSVIKSVERGLLVYDGYNEHFVKNNCLIDLVKWKQTGRISFK